MISEVILRKGLAALGEAFGRKVDGTTVKLWAHACRELDDERFRHGVDVVIREDVFFPAPARVLAAGFTMPRAAAPALPLAPRGSEQFWADGAQARATLDVVRSYPMTELERGSGLAGSIHYVERIAVLAGLLAPDAPRPGRPMPAAREPGCEG